MVAGLHDFFVTAIFMLSVYTAGFLLSKGQAPALVAHIGMGALWMGAGWLPREFAKPLEAVGAVGLMLMLFDGGVNMNIPILRRLGIRATAVALSGVALPMLMSWALFSALGVDPMEGLACGSALASTGIGFTLTLMKNLDLLGTPLGQLVAAAAMIDDVSSMVLLAMLKGATTLQDEGRLDLFAMLKPVLASAGLFVASVLLRMLVGRLLDCGKDDHDVTEEQHPPPTTVLKKKAEHQSSGSSSFCSNELIFLLAVSAGVGWALLADKIGSTHLLGCFLAGVISTAWKPFPEIWEPAVEPILPWMTMAFFACTVGFAVPVEALAAEDWSLVVLVTIVAILSKIGTGLFAAPPSSQGYTLQAFQVGTAMVGRGELGFMQISTGYQLGLVSLQTYGATVWGLLVASVLGPFMFRIAVKFASYRAVKEKEMEVQSTAAETATV